MWSTKIQNWKRGIDIPMYRADEVSTSFFWETSPVHKYKDTLYQEKWIVSSEMERQSEEDYRSFHTKLVGKQVGEAVSFANLSGDSKLIIPVPNPTKKYTNLKRFMDNAPIEHQQTFWKVVAEEITNMLQQHEKIWVSTHGLGVPFLHVRIDTYPKYYQTVEFT